MTDDGVHRNAIAEEAVAFDAPKTFIVVSKEGDDTNGNGSFESPLLTIAAAIALWSAARPVIYVLAGEYDEVALVWPSITGLHLVGLGPVLITNTDTAIAVLAIAPTFTAASFEAYIKDVEIASVAQIGLSIANAAMTKKLIVELDGLTCEADSTGNSITIAGTVSGQAIRVYAKDLNCEGLVEFTANDAGSRLRVKGGELMGGLTTVGAVAAQTELMGVVMKASGLTIATEWLSSNAGCLYRTDPTGVCGTYADTANG
jgi:hypothetical protein